MANLLQADSPGIRKLTDIVLANIEKENFSVRELAEYSGMSTSRLNRQLRKTCGKSVNQFIREIRLLKAQEMLQDETVTANEVSYKVGFSSPSYFNKCFHDFFGYPPGQVRKEIFLKPEKPLLNLTSEDRKQPLWKLPQLSRTLIPGITLIIVAASIYIIPGILNRNETKSSDGRISIAVMPFRNMTNDTTWNYWQRAIQNLIITNLCKDQEELIVRQVESIDILLRGKGLVDNAAITPALSSRVSKKLNAGRFVSGSIFATGTEMRVDAKIFDTRRGEILWSSEIKKPAKEELIFEIAETLSEQIRNFLVISKLKEDEPEILRRTPVPDSNPQAYRYLQSGDRAFEKHDYKTSLERYLHAFRIDSTMQGLCHKIAASYLNQDKYSEGKEWLLKSYNQRDINDIVENIKAQYYYSFYFQTPDSALKYALQMIDLDDGDPRAYFNAGDCYWMMEQYDKSIPYFKKVLAIYKNWGLKPDRVYFYAYPGIAYHRTGQYRQEKKLYRKSQRDYPDDWALTDQYAVLAFSQGDTVEGNRWVSKFISARKDMGISESRNNVSMAYFFIERGDLDRAEIYMKKAIQLEPENPDRINQYAYFLIDKNRNIQQGLEMIGKALDMRPDHYVYLDTKGWGLYKLGQYREAFKILQQSWDLRMKKAIYYHPAAHHLELAKNAVTASQ